MSWKHLFSRAFAAAPGRLHFAAHSHHLWPDASFDGQVAAWQDAATLADRKWDRVMGPVWEEAQAHVARELGLPDPTTVVFASNTHDFLVRLVSALPKRPLRVLASDGEFHSFRRQMTRWAEDGSVELITVRPEMLAETARGGTFDLIFISQVLFNSGAVMPDLDALAALADPTGPWVVIDGYHGFMAVPTDLGAIAGRVFYTAGGYKYAMAGEGVCFLHAPARFASRPVVTGWYAEFEDLHLPAGSIGYAPNARRFLGATFDPSGLYRFNAVQRMLRAEGLTTERISAHVAELQQSFGSACAMADFTLLNPLDCSDHARFLAYRGDQAQALSAVLRDQDIVTDVRGDVIRIGFGLYHDAQDVDRLAASIESWREAGIL